MLNMFNIESRGTAELVVARERALSDPRQKLVFLLVAFGFLLLGQFKAFSDSRSHSLLLILKIQLDPKRTLGIDKKEENPKLRIFTKHEPF